MFASIKNWAQKLKFQILRPISGDLAGAKSAKDKFCADGGINENVTENRNPEFCDIMMRAMIWCRSEYSPTAPAAKTHEWLLVYFELVRGEKRLRLIALDTPRCSGGYVNASCGCDERFGDGWEFRKQLLVLRVEIAAQFEGKGDKLRVVAGDSVRCD